MTNLRYAILENRDVLTTHQRSRLLEPRDVLEAIVIFGYPLAAQLERDFMARFKAWDSFSMVLQSEDLLPSESDAEKFRQWAFVRLGLTPWHIGKFHEKISPPGTVRYCLSHPASTEAKSVSSHKSICISIPSTPATAVMRTPALGVLCCSLLISFQPVVSLLRHDGGRRTNAWCKPFPKASPKFAGGS